jgi:hypothetical protein
MAAQEMYEERSAGLPAAARLRLARRRRQARLARRAIAVGTWAVSGVALAAGLAGLAAGLR